MTMFMQSIQTFCKRQQSNNPRSPFPNRPRPSSPELRKRIPVSHWISVCIRPCRFTLFRISGLSKHSVLRSIVTSSTKSSFKFATSSSAKLFPGFVVQVSRSLWTAAPRGDTSRLSMSSCTVVEQFTGVLVEGRLSEFERDPALQPAVKSIREAIKDRKRTGCLVSVCRMLGWVGRKAIPFQNFLACLPNGVAEKVGNSLYLFWDFGEE